MFCSVFAIVLCAVFVLGSTLVQALPFGETQSLINQINNNNNNDSVQVATHMVL